MSLVSVVKVNLILGPSITMFAETLLVSLIHVYFAALMLLIVVQREQFNCSEEIGC